MVGAMDGVRGPLSREVFPGKTQDVPDQTPIHLSIAICTTVIQLFYTQVQSGKF